jgi:hypothetical protein
MLQAHLFVLKHAADEIRHILVVEVVCKEDGYLNRRCRRKAMRVRGEEGKGPKAHHGQALPAANKWPCGNPAGRSAGRWRLVLPGFPSSPNPGASVREQRREVARG